VKVGYQHGLMTQDVVWMTNTQNLTYRFNNGVPNQLTQSISPWMNRSRTGWDAVFAQERWTRDRLTVQAAVRFDRARSWFPTQQEGPSKAKLRVSYDRIRHLGRRLLGEQEAERARIARELHDDINQQLAVLSIELDRLRSDQMQVHSAKRLSRALETAEGISTSVRELSHRLHPSRLRLIGLVASLDSLCRDLSPAHLRIAICHRGVPPEIDQNIALCIFRVAQEALGNAVKHSNADHVWIDLTGRPSSVALTIADDGKGFDVDSLPNAGLGLMSMTERVESVGGVLEIQATPASGTRLTVTVPTRASESALPAVALA
jgi:two-component system sensor histidine kinase UhpB